VLGYPSKDVLSSLKRQLKSLKKEMVKLEERLLKNVKSEYPESLILLKTIPGIGEKTALMFYWFLQTDFIVLRVQKSCVVMQE